MQDKIFNLALTKIKMVAPLHSYSAHFRKMEKKNDQREVSMQ